MRQATQMSIGRVLRRRPKTVVAALVLVLAVAAVGIWLAVRGSTTPPPRLVAAVVGQLDETVTLTGTIEPSQRADLDFTTSGEVTAVDVTVGQQVAEGQALASIDAATLRSQVAQARSALASARARLSADQSAGAPAAQLTADRAAVTSAQAQLDLADQNAAQATLTAPFAGTVAAVNVTLGQQVAAGGAVASGSGASQSTGGAPGAAGAASGGSGGAASGGAGGGTGGGTSGGAGGSASVTSAVVVVSTGSLVVDATVDDTQVGMLAGGQPAAITANGATTPVPGTVTTIGLVASTTSGVASYPVTVTVTGSPPGLHLGSTAQVAVTTTTVSDAVLVPTAAVRGTGPDASVTVMEAGREVTRPVTAGLSSGGNTQIVSGLAAGDQVVLPAGGAAPSAGSGFGGFGGGQPRRPAPTSSGGG